MARRAQRALRPEAAEPGDEREARRWEFFLEAMPLGNRAEDFGVVLEAFDRGVVLPDQAAYDRFRSALEAGFLDAFHRRFYAEREAWRRRDPAGWRAQLSPYPGLLEVLRRRSAELTLAIATAKDAGSVHALLEDWGAGDLFARELVFDKETGVSKRAHLSALRERLGLEFPALTFVDDKLNHLESVASLGVRCALAGWGYNAEREQHAARAAGFAVPTLESFEAEILRG